MDGTPQCLLCHLFLKCETCLESFKEMAFLEFQVFDTFGLAAKIHLIRINGFVTTKKGNKHVLFFDPFVSRAFLPDTRPVFAHKQSVTEVRKGTPGAHP